MILSFSSPGYLGLPVFDETGTPVTNTDEALRVIAHAGDLSALDATHFGLRVSWVVRRVAVEIPQGVELYFVAPMLQMPGNRLMALGHLDRA